MTYDVSFGNLKTFTEPMSAILITLLDNRKRFQQDIGWCASAPWNGMQITPDNEKELEFLSIFCEPWIHCELITIFFRIELALESRHLWILFRIVLKWAIIGTMKNELEVRNHQQSFQRNWVFDDSLEMEFLWFLDFVMFRKS